VEKKWTWPPGIVEYLQRWILEFRSPAFLVTDREGRVVSKGGDLRRYDLEDLHEGDRATEKAYFLEGLLPLDSSRSALSRVEAAPGVFADIHLFPVDSGDCMLLLDATEEVVERTHIERALRQTEEQLRQAEKMEALGRLAGGVAHDFNNLLTIIMGYSHILTDSLTGDQPRSAALEITEAAERAAAMTRHLLSFSRRQVRRVEILDLNQVISRAQPLLRRLIGEDVTLAVTLDPALAAVEADRGQIDQVLINLAANARDAMPYGGTLEILTRNVNVDETSMRQDGGRQLRHGSYVSISVKDSGHGMDTETRARAFEPFFTSKESGQGTGLGLSIVYGIVTQSGGEILLVSEIGRGTQVEILLPSVQKTPAPSCAPVETTAARGTGTILVVEDDDAVRKLMREVLAELGYAVLEYTDPSAAIAWCQAHPARVELLLTDLIMPEMNGSKLAARILAVHPETRVLYVSGYAEESFARRGLDLTGATFLEKPFTPRLLADRVREALSRPRDV
jgi:signal transduction histidine kinase/ActR/RegA family two-component response regulator